MERTGSWSGWTLADLGALAAPVARVVSATEATYLTLMPVPGYRDSNTIRQDETQQKKEPIQLPCNTYFVNQSQLVIAVINGTDVKVDAQLHTGGHGHGRNHSQDPNDKRGHPTVQYHTDNHHNGIHNH